MPAPSPVDDRQWSLERLDKAYQQGYLVGLAGQPAALQPYPVAVLAAAWEAGWDDGQTQRGEALAERLRAAG